MFQCFCFLKHEEFSWGFHSLKFLNTRARNFHFLEYNDFLGASFLFQKIWNFFSKKIFRAGVLRKKYNKFFQENFWGRDQKVRQSTAKKYYEILKFDLSVCGKVRFLILLKKLPLKRIFSGSVYLYLSGGAHIN